MLELKGKSKEIKEQCIDSLIIALLYFLLGFLIEKLPRLTWGSPL